VQSFSIRLIILDQYDSCYNSLIDDKCPTCRKIYPQDIPQDGIYRKWWTKEKLKIECVYRNGVKVGMYREWHKNGQRYIVCTYKNGQYDGEYKKWNDLGALAIKCNFKNGVLHGEYKRWTRYRENPSIVCTYKNGEKIT
jgi:antitoxin component YwqK of YwqJK toxin-antitoxin module